MWIESHQSIRNHPKVKKAARLAGVDQFEMIGLLHCLWWWALDYAPDGNVSKYSAEDIEGAIDWGGTPGALYSALIECGFNGHCGLLEKVDGAIVIHDWYEYGGKLLDRREANADRMRERRAAHVRDTTAARTPATNITDKQTEPNNTNQPAQPDGLNDLQRHVLQSFGGKRFANDVQKAVVASWDTYPRENVDSALKWAATKGFKLGQAIASLDKALPKWGAPKQNGNGNGQRLVDVPFDLVEYDWSPDGKKVERKK